MSSDPQRITFSLSFIRPPVRNGSQWDWSGSQRVSRQARVTWPKLATILTTHIIANEKESVELFSPATFDGGGRKVPNAVEVCLLVVDIDRGLTLEQVREALTDLGFTALLYSTFSSSAAEFKCRVVFPLSAPVPAPEWQGFFELAMKALGPIGAAADRSCKEPSRFYFLPSHAPGVEPVAGRFREFDDAFLDPAPIREEARLLAEKRKREQEARASSPRSLSESSDSRYVDKAVADELTELAKAMPGEQQRRLNKSAFKMGSLLASENRLDLRASIETAMIAVALAWPYSREPWTEREANRHIQDGFDAGVANPRPPRVDDRDRGGSWAPDSPSATVATAPSLAIAPGSVPTQDPQTRYADVVALMQQWLYLPDARVLAAILGAVAANVAEGDPVWLMIIGPPGSGKTEALNPLRALPFAHSAATITEAALLSGTKKSEKAADSRGGLLKAIGPFGLLVLKDFTSILSQNRDSRASLLAALREIYDGSWTRHVGVDGGRSLAWEGKLGLIAACTQTIDGHHAVMASMGERFLFFRLEPVDAKMHARRALSHRNRESQMRKELGDVVARLFTVAGIPPDLTEEVNNRLVNLATLAVRCRSAVERDRRDREIELIPEPEAPGRMALALSRHHSGMLSVGVPSAVAWDVTVKIALDCMPAIRRSLLEFILRNPERRYRTSEIALNLGYPASTTRRCLEDLTAHGLLIRDKAGESDSARDLWSASDFTVELWQSVALNVLEASEALHTGRENVPAMSEHLQPQRCA